MDQTRDSLAAALGAPPVTAHARARMQQRGIRSDALEALLDFGSARHLHSKGRELVFFDTGLGLVKAAFGRESPKRSRPAPSLVAARFAARGGSPLARDRCLGAGSAPRDAAMRSRVGRERQADRVRAGEPPDAASVRGRPARQDLGQRAARLGRGHQRRHELPAAADRAAQRPGAKIDVAAALDDQLLGGVGQHQLQAALGQPARVDEDERRSLLADERGEPVVLVERQAADVVVEHLVRAVLRRQHQREARIARDVDAFERIHLDGYAQAHSISLRAARR